MCQRKQLTKYLQSMDPPKRQKLIRMVSSTVQFKLTDGRAAPCLHRGLTLGQGDVGVVARVLAPKRVQERKGGALRT